MDIFTTDSTDSLFYAIWILCICLNTLTNIRLDSNRSMDDMNKSIIEVLDLAFSCNNILENINFIHLSKRLLVNVNNSPASLNHYSSTTQCILLDANKELNPTVWYISHLVDKIYTHFHSYQNQILRRSSIAPFIYNNNNNNNGIIGNNNNNNNNNNSNNPITTEISSKFSSKHKSTVCRDEKDTYWTESYAVELWLCIFNYIKRIGQMIGLWCKKPNSYHYEKLSLFNKIITSNLNKQSVSSIFNISSDYQKNKEEEEEEEEEESVDQLNFQTNKQNEIIYQDNSLLLAHYHLIPLFNSSIIYSQIFSAIGETLIGFLKLIHNPRRSYEIVFDLADFMFSQGAYESASWLYESIINFFDESSWIGLITSARLCLAWCLHFLCIEKQYETKTDCEIARKYIQVCLTLSDINEILRIPKYTDTVNPNYWWMEAIEFRNSLSAFHQSIITEPYDMSSLFCLKSVELEGVCDCGYQLIYAVLESNSERHFKASVHITASEPSYVDWQTLLNPNEFLPYHVMNKTNQSLTSHSESQLHIINLTTLPSFSITNNNLIDNANSSVTVVNNDNNNHKVSLRSQLSIPSGTGSQLHLEQINKYLLPASTTVSTCRSYSNIPDSSKEYKYTTLSVVGNPLNNTGINIRSKFDTRLGSLLNVAASLASKPAWRSQDIMEMVNDEHNAAVSIRDTEQFLQRMGKTSRITSDGFIDPVVSRTPQVTRRYSLHQTKKRSCYSFSINSKHDIFGNENDKSTVVPGFLIPERLFIICYDDNDNDDDFVTADQYLEKSTKKQSTGLSVNATEVHFVSDIDSDHFGPNWRNVELMQTLLPKPEIVVSSNNLDKLYPVVFGTCQPIPVQLRLGKLGLPNDCKLSTSLYRIRPNSKYPNNKREYPYYNAAVTSITNSNDENDIANNSTFTNGVSLGNISYANDYSLISSKPESEEKNTHPNNDSNALINRAIFNQFILEDGPADFVRDSNSFKLQHNLCKINHPMPTYPPGCCLQLSRPLYLSADSCSDQFALSMPSGHYCVLLLNIIKPLAFKLNIFPLPTTYIIFSLHIACVDTDPDSIISPEIYCSLEKPCSSPPTKEGGSQQVTGTVDILFDNTEETRIESLNGDLIDNKLTKAYINHLTPFSIPWRFKSLEYNNFLKACKEFHYKPVGRFECTMNRIDAIKIDQEIRVDCHIEQQI
ncbi:unnamed protein product [Heterobilharzia americana]|nr:unnamed protein product [Heterobilharzia americana]